MIYFIILMISLIVAYVMIRKHIWIKTKGELVIITVICGALPALVLSGTFMFGVNIYFGTVQEVIETDNPNIVRVVSRVDNDFAFKYIMLNTGNSEDLQFIENSE